MDEAIPNDYQPDHLLNDFLGQLLVAKKTAAKTSKSCILMLFVDINQQLPDFLLEIKFSIESDIMVLFGPSGCGKTTTLRSIAGLLKSEAGWIVYEA